MKSRFDNQMSIQKLIWEKIDEISKAKDQLDPVVCSEALVELSVLYASLNKHIAERQEAFNKFYWLAQEENKDLPAVKLKVIVQASNEWNNLNKALRLEKSLIECIRSLKKYIRAKERELEASNNQ